VDIKARNRRYLLIDVATFGVLSGVVGTFLSIFVWGLHCQLWPRSPSPVVFSLLRTRS
jgi:hypothetical protein